MSQKIRIKLKSYDHNLVDKSAEKIVKTVKATGAVIFDFHPCGAPPFPSCSPGHYDPGAGLCGESGISAGFRLSHLDFHLDARGKTKPELGHFKKAGVTPMRHLAEFKGFEGE